MSWQRHGSVLAWPRDWQRPNKTEEWAYERCLATLGRAPFLEVLCFPWATLIDLQRNRRHERANELLDALYWAPPRITLRRVTIMQHIWAKDMLPQLQMLGITDVYWSHATHDEFEWPGGIRVHAFPLYPACYGTGTDPSMTLPSEQRPYLYSFIGAYQPGLYLSKVREWIYSLPPQPDVYVRQRHEWHYEGQVYREQVKGRLESADAVAQRKTHEQEYRNLLEKSIFSLCPSGSGPNSIRLWETLGAGGIPVILSDQLRLVGCSEDWQAACVFCPESEDEVMALPDKLDRLRRDMRALLKMRTAAHNLWRKEIQELKLVVPADFIRLSSWGK